MLFRHFVPFNVFIELSDKLDALPLDAEIIVIRRIVMPMEISGFDAHTVQSTVPLYLCTGCSCPATFNPLQAKALSRPADSDTQVSIPDRSMPS